MDRIALDGDNYQVFDKLDYAVVYRVEDYSFHFNVFEVIGHDGDTGGCLFFRDNGDLGRYTKDAREAKVTHAGYIKWDGCSNIDFDAEDSGQMMHFCGLDKVKQFSQLLVELYLMAESMIPHWSD